MNPKTLLSLLLAANSSLLVPLATHAATSVNIPDNSKQVERQVLKIEITELNQNQSKEIIEPNRNNDYDKDYDQGRGRRRRR